MSISTKQNWRFTAVAALAVILSARPASTTWADEPEAKAAATAEAVKTPDRWIGVACDKIEREGLPGGQGLLVTFLPAGSPAAKAGIRELDVLLEADGKPMKSLDDLYAAVAAAGDNDLKITVQRGEPPQTIVIAVHPELRPGAAGAAAQAQPGNVPRNFQRFLGEIPGGGNGIVIRRAQPGIIFPGQPGAVAKLPADMSVSITKQGDQPAKIVVRQGEKTFEATVDKIGELPADVRQQIEPLLVSELPSAALAGHGVTLRINTQVFGEGPNQPGAVGGVIIGGGGGPQFNEQMRALQQQMEQQMRQAQQQIEQQMRQVTEQMRNMQQQLQPAKPPQDPAQPVNPQGQLPKAGAEPNPGQPAQPVRPSRPRSVL
jgi:membrane-associated protease RseP (regulator of RpoE activity)